MTADWPDLDVLGPDPDAPPIQGPLQDWTVACPLCGDPTPPGNVHVIRVADDPPCAIVHDACFDRACLDFLLADPTDPDPAYHLVCGYLSELGGIDEDWIPPYRATPDGLVDRDP